jgi:hypothetical protein
MYDPIPIKSSQFGKNQQNIGVNVALARQDIATSEKY